MIRAENLTRLVQQAGGGDRRAFAGLYDVTSARAYGICRRLLDDPAVAEEVAEQAYREVWRRASAYDPTQASAMAWVMSIVHRAAVARAHQPGVRRCSSVPPGVGAAAGSSDAILAQLSTLEWASIELAYFGGRRHTEVAEVLGLTTGTAQTQIRDGLLRVRELMDVG